MNINDIPASVDNLMSNTMAKIAAAAAEQNLAQLESLTRRATELKQIKEQIAAIQNRLIDFASESQIIKRESASAFAFAQREIRLEVSQGMINQNLLTLTESLKRGQIRIGEELTVECLPKGERFKTVVMASGNKVQERGAIGRFYRDAGIKAGDFVILREISRGTWQLSKSQNGSVRELN